MYSIHFMTAVGEKSVLWPLQKLDYFNQLEQYTGTFVYRRMSRSLIWMMKKIDWILVKAYLLRKFYSSFIIACFPRSEAFCSESQSHKIIRYSLKQKGVYD